MLAVVVFMLANCHIIVSFYKYASWRLSKGQIKPNLLSSFKSQSKFLYNAVTFSKGKTVF